MIVQGTIAFSVQLNCPKFLHLSNSDYDFEIHLFTQKNWGTRRTITKSENFNWCSRRKQCIL